MIDFESYKKSVNMTCFELVLNWQNENYFHKTIKKWHHKNQLIFLKENRQILIPLSDKLSTMMVNIVKLYHSIQSNLSTDTIKAQENMFVDSLQSYELLKTIKEPILYEKKMSVEDVLNLFDDCIETIEKKMCINISISPLKIHLESLRGEIINFTENNSNISSVNKDHDRIWFKVGVIIATGEMGKLWLKFNQSPREIAKHLEHPNYEKYILASMNNYTKTNTDKNIFHSRSKMEKIFNHCKKNNLPITKDFENSIPSK